MSVDFLSESLVVYVTTYIHVYKVHVPKQQHRGWIIILIDSNLLEVLRGFPILLTFLPTHGHDNSSTNAKSSQ